MDGSVLFDPKYLPIILATLVGFSALAAALLVPIYRFLDREQEVAEKWTPEQIAERLRQRREQARAEAESNADTASDAESTPDAEAAPEDDAVEREE